MSDEFCPCGHAWTKVFNTMLFQDCYYCHTEDKIYIPTVREVTKEEIKESFISDRFADIRQYAKMIEAKKKVKYDDLVSLGLIDDR